MMIARQREQKLSENSSPCYYVTQKFLFDTSLKEFSTDSKLLVGVMLNCANSPNEVMEAAMLVQKLGSDSVSELISSISKLEELQEEY